MPLPNPTSYASVGGEIENAFEVVDPTTDLSADLINITRADCAGMTRTAVRGWVRFAGHATAPTVSAHEELWGAGSASDPTVVHSATGSYLVTLPASVIDERGDTIDVSVSGGWVNVSGSVCYQAQASYVGPNQLQVYTFNAAGTANDAVGVSLTLYVV